MKTFSKSMMVGATAVALTLILASCGGDDDDEPVALSDEVSDSVGASTAAFVGYLQALTAGAETAEPLTIKGSFTAPADETAEPTPLT